MSSVLGLILLEVLASEDLGNSLSLTTAALHWGHAFRSRRKVTAGWAGHWRRTRPSRVKPHPWHMTSCCGLLQIHWDLGSPGAGVTPSCLTHSAWLLLRLVLTVTSRDTPTLGARRDWNRELINKIIWKKVQAICK